MTLENYNNCPKCGEEIERIPPLDTQQNTKIEPCGCIISAAELEEIHKGEQ